MLDAGAHFHLFDTATGEETLKFPKQGRLLSNLAITTDSKTLLSSACGDGQAGNHPVSLWDLSSGTTWQQLLLSPRACSGLM